MNDIFNLSGKTAIITGASSGLGKHFAKSLSKSGANIEKNKQIKTKI